MKRYTWEDVTVEELIETSKLELNVTTDVSMLNTVVGKRQVLVAIKCDTCDYVVIDYPNEMLYARQEFVEINGKFGWPSIHDGSEYNLDLCHTCVAELGKVTDK